MILKTGDTYWVNLEPTIGDEIEKKRRVVILNPGHHRHLRLAIDLPITHWRPEWKDQAFFVPVEPLESRGLAKKSAVDCFQLRAMNVSWNVSAPFLRMRREESDEKSACSHPRHRLRTLFLVQHRTIE